MVMCGRVMLNDLLGELTEYAKMVFGDKLKQVILYGSYARGDFNEDSDIDVMIMADILPEEVSKYRKKISHFCAEINLENNILIMPVIQSRAVFEKWKNTIPFYKNVSNEGVLIYG